MTIKATLSLTERHHRFLMEQVENGFYDSTSGVVAAALDELMWVEEQRQRMITASADIIRERMATPSEAYVDEETAFGPAFKSSDRDEE